MAEGIYRAGNDPGGSAMLPGAGGEAFGATVGAGIADLGAEIREQYEKQREKERVNAYNSQVADAGVKFAEVSGALTTEVQGMREGAAPGAAGHAAATREKAQKAFDDYLEAIPDERVRNQYRDRAQQTIERLAGDEDAFERVQRIEKSVGDVDRQGTLFANQQATKPDAEGLLEAIETIGITVDAMRMPDDTKVKVRREQQRKIVLGFANTVQLQNPGGLVKVLDAGGFNEYLEPEDLDRLRSGALVETRRLEHADQARQAEAKATVGEQVRMFRARIAAGDEPTDAEFETVGGAAKAAGLEVEAFNVQVERSKILINRETRDWNPQQYATKIGELRAKGDKRTPDENIQLSQLEAISSSRIAEFNNDPQARAANIGNPAPAVDWAAPSRQALDSRVSWARGYARQNGLVNPPYLSDAEMKPFRDRVAQGAAGKLEVAATLRNMFGAGVAGEIARRIDGNDNDLQLAIGLPPVTASFYTRGVDALTRNKALWDKERGPEIFAEIASSIPQALRTPVFEAAKAIAAGQLDQRGGGEFDEGIYRRALHLAMGASQGPNGELQGGIGYYNNKPVWLPPSMGQRELERRMATADGAAMGRAAGGKIPYWWTGGKRGRKIFTREISALDLETVRPGVYRVKGPVGGYIADDKGDPWLIDVSKLR